MKHTLKKLSDTRVSATLTVDKATLDNAKKLAIKELSKTIKVAGFRAGKVPAKVAEKNIDPNQLASQTVDYALNAAVNQLIDAEDLRVLDQPKIEIKKFVPFDTLEIDVEMEVLPEVKLGNYKKLKAKLKADKLEQSEIDEVITRIQQGFAEKTEVKRAAKDGDEVVIDFEGRDKSGEAIDGAKGDDYTLVLGSNTFIPGFEDKIVGHKAGEAFSIDVTFPKDYHADHLKGAKVTFAINLKKVQEVTLPELDDELAKKAGPFDTAKALKDDIKRELTAQKERAALDILRDDLLGELVMVSNVPVPEVLLADQVQALERDATQNLMYRGQTVEQYLQANGFKDAEQWRAKELTEVARRRVQAGLVLAELSKAEKIEIDAAELEAELEKRKAEAPKMADQLDTPEARRDLANRVVTQKTIDRLVELNSKK